MEGAAMANRVSVSRSVVDDASQIRLLRTICPNCGAENDPARLDCERCGSKIRIGGPYRWSRQKLHLAGTVGWKPAELNLQFRGWSDAAGTLTISGEARSFEISGGTFFGADDTRLRLHLTTRGDPTKELGDHSLQHASLVGSFDGASFVGSVEDEGENSIARFEFRVSQTSDAVQTSGTTESPRRRDSTLKIALFTTYAAVVLLPVVFFGWRGLEAVVFYVIGGGILVIALAFVNRFLKDANDLLNPEEGGRGWNVFAWVLATVLLAAGFVLIRAFNVLADLW